MTNPTLCVATDRYSEVDYLVEREEESYIHPTVGIPFSHSRCIDNLSQIPAPQDYHPSRREQSIVPGDPEVGAYSQDALFYFSFAQELSGCGGIHVPTQEGPELSGSNNATYLPPLDPHPIPYVPTVNPTYDGAPADFFDHQQFPPHTSFSNHEGNASFSPADQHYFQGPSPSAMPECNNDPYSGGEQSFSDPDGTDGSYSRVMGSSLQLTTGQSTLMVDHKLNAWRHTTASVSDPVSGAGSGETADLPAKSPLVDDVRSQVRKKRKPVATPDSLREAKHTRYTGPRRLVPRGPVPVGVVQSRSALK